MVRCVRMNCTDQIDFHDIKTDNGAPSIRLELDVLYILCGDKSNPFAHRLPTDMN